MKGYRLSILRHGITDANENGIYIGKTDLPLSENGREALQEKYETHEYPKVQRVYTSPLERAVQSAEILFPDRELVIVDDLREMDFGVFEGLSVEDLIELDSYKKWLKGGLDNPPPNGESLRNMMLRCYSALNLMILD
ncbi:MAG: histidine phosphatase family protein, partial [Oscillospiraceae bacterium]|nr:histidine phosphatase family protein [Oscillospiraceae bacterium]